MPFGHCNTRDYRHQRIFESLHPSILFALLRFQFRMFNPALILLMTLLIALIAFSVEFGCLCILRLSALLIDSLASLIGQHRHHDERTSSPVSSGDTDVAAMSHVAVSHASAIGAAIGNANGGLQSQVISKSIYNLRSSHRKLSSSQVYIIPAQHIILFSGFAARNFRYSSSSLLIIIASVTSFCASRILI